MNRDTLFSSRSDNWPTPQWLFDLLDHTHGPFTLDVCATAANSKVAERYFTASDDGLAQDWGSDACWMNPPYARGVIDRWVAKAIDAAANGATVVALLPARTESGWFWQVWQHANELSFIKGRITFGDAANPAPFPSCVAVFRPRKTWAGLVGTTYTVAGRRRPFSMVTVQPLRSGTKANA